MFKKVLCLGLLGVSSCMQGSPTTAALCEQTVRDYAVLRDNGPVEAYANLFTQDGTFYLGDTVVQGREALIARHITANAAASWRHMMGDIRITEVEGEIKGQSRFVVRTGAPASPSPVSREIVGHYEDTFTVASGSCKLLRVRFISCLIHRHNG